MKKNIAFVILLTTLIFLFSACSFSFQELIINKSQTSDSYIFEEDFQYFISNGIIPIAKAPNGYYFIKNSLLTFFDGETNRSTVVCDKINCSHNDSDCSAYFSNREYNPIILHYYNGSLFTEYIARENNVATHYVQQISLDGKTRTNRCLLFKSTGSASYNFSIHRGYVYLIKGSANANDPNQSTENIYKIPLDAKGVDEQSEIFSYTGYLGGITYLELFGNHLYFSLSSYADVKGNGYSIQVYDYDLINESYEILDIPNYRYGFSVENRNLYYYDYVNKYYSKYNLDTKQEVGRIQLDEIGYMSFDGNYLYIDTQQSVNLELTTDRKIYVIDSSLNVIDTIIFSENYGDCYFGAEDLLLFSKIEDYSSRFYYYDKSLIGTGQSIIVSAG